MFHIVKTLNEFQILTYILLFSISTIIISIGVELNVLEDSPWIKG
jgi:hypothetical protein